MSTDPTKKPIEQLTPMLLYPLTRPLKVVFFFDLVAAMLWVCCLLRLLVLLPLVGRRFLPAGIADFFHVVATLPLVGFFVVNLFGRRNYSASDLWGLVHGSRMAWICYGVIYPHPRIAKHTSYSVLMLAWCVQNVVDASYYAFRVKTRSSPLWLFWLHHHVFFLTFPTALLSEMAIVFLSLKFTEPGWHEIAVKATLLLYVPMAYFTFQYLLRRKDQKYDQYMEKRRLGRSANVELRDVSHLAREGSGSPADATTPSEASSL